MNQNFVTMGNIHGNVKLISSINMSWCPLQIKPYNGKILSLHWVKNDDDTKQFNLFASGPDGNILWWIINCLHEKRTFSCEVKSYFRLPHCRQRWPNSVFIIPNDVTCSDDDDDDYTEVPLVLCGDRRGSLHVFKGCDRLEPLDPVHSYLGIHGRNGVTHITSNRGFIYTTGRDGYLRQYKLHGTNLHLVDKRKVFKGIEWIEQLNFTPDGDMLVLGFHTVDFVIWSKKRNEILHRIPCGGGHRVWDILYKKSIVETTAMFTYLKKMTVHVHKLPQGKTLRTSILQESFHGREATCVRFIGPLTSGTRDNVHLMATGSEDTDINIMAYIHGGKQKRFRKIFKCQGHISSVRCLALTKVKSSETTSCDYLLFSGGGRASLKCWSVNISYIPLNEDILSNDGLTTHPVCTLLTELPNQVSRYKRKRLQRQIMEGSSCDVRFMSLSVFSLSELLNVDCSIYGVIAGCSDGQLRLYAMDSNMKSFELINGCLWHDHCVLTVGHFIYTSDAPHLIAYTADTAGKIAFWDLTNIFAGYFYRNCDEKDDVMEPVDKIDSDKETLLQDERISSREPLDKEELCIQEGLNKDFEGLRVGVDGLIGDTSAVGSMETGDESFREPFYQHNLHQSGVNCISLLQDDTGEYMLCSGGDDGAITVVLFKLGKTNTILHMHSWSFVSVADAHTSSTTGIKILHNGFLLSTSVDQRLKLWKVDIDKNFAIVVTLIENHCVDVADIQDIDVEKDKDGVHHIVICGVGLQMITLLDRET